MEVSAEPSPEEAVVAWSTRQVAELAGTSLRAVRHYHDVGLLDEPERKSNGYKSYGVTHLVRLLRIKRLRDLGFSLTRIAEMGDADEHPEHALRALDGEMAASIERLQRIRRELALVLREPTPTDLPRELAAATTAADIPDTDRALLVVLARVLGPTTLRAYAETLEAYYADPGVLELDRLPPDADQRTRCELAERLLPAFQTLLADHPQLRAPITDAPHGTHFAGRTISAAIKDLYNPAQIDVIRRMEQHVAAV
ncbi:MerR family transcriptional regulator [Nocardia sp. NPDC051756]|uniref:helix-turn-helix domain-containing protein n=1 Tax=Nocardia sp. NPDC051756 TaxID=3154751 RepID=UPI00341D4DD5